MAVRQSKRREHAESEPRSPQRRQVEHAMNFTVMTQWVSAFPGKVSSNMTQKDKKPPAKLEPELTSSESGDSGQT
jgi:hypothetical protein